MLKSTIIGLTVMSFVLISCGETKKEQIVKNTVPNVQVHKIGELKIAYYDQDSMKLNFEYYKREDAAVTKKQIVFQAKLEERRKEMETYYNNYMKRAQNNELSEVEAAEYQRNLQQQEAVNMQFQEVEGSKIERETMAKLEAIGNKIEQFSKKYCEENGIDILMIYAKGGQFNYINPSMNVTKEFTAYLNQNQETIAKETKKK